MDKPRTLYKYESISVQSLLNLKSQTIYFGPPANFNDPYDCAISARVREPTDSEINDFRKKYSEIDEIPELTRNQLKTIPVDQLKKWLMRATQQSANEIVEKNIEQRGVSCFSEVNNELLMWSHYADKYKGFCLEFDTNYEPFSKVRKVTYTDKMPTLSITEALINNDYDQFLELYCTKSGSWAYEKEWRCIHQVAGTSWTYESDALVSIYFGPEIDPRALEIICLILKGQNSTIKFWRGFRSSESFSVEFKPFEYTSNLEARKLGIIT